MKTVLRILLILILFIALSLITDLSVDSFFVNTIYTVSGIMFSLGLGLIVTFNMHGVNNPSYIDQIRQNINHVRNSFLGYFSVSTACYILDFYLRQNDANVLMFNAWSFNFSILFSLIMLYSIVYFILNFIAIQTLNNDIFDTLQNSK